MPSNFRQSVFSVPSLPRAIWTELAFVVSAATFADVMLSMGVVVLSGIKSSSNPGLLNVAGSPSARMICIVLSPCFAMMYSPEPNKI